MNKKIGKRTIILKNKPRIISAFSIVGPREGEGPLKEYFDHILKDEMFDTKSYEKAESKMLLNCIKEAILRANLKDKNIDYLFSGDLLNQIIASSFAARELEIPFFGLYGACSTMTEALSLGSILLDSDIGNYIICSTSSHFCAAERQFRFPLEYGSQRSKTSQWTVTGSGAMILGRNGDFPKITSVTTGIVKDYGIKDANNMGAAMAPAAVDTIYNHFKDTGKTPKDYDVIVTGDLGTVGKTIAENLILEYGYDIRDNYLDCGDMIFFSEVQGTEAGGSGCGCSASVAAGYFYKKLIKKEIKSMLLISTGALMSPTSSLQGETIPGIAHAVSIESD
ncbi:stage V sporulation protein AD [uncultured Clostridium sp.]|uniref:stage V sporulation protein AD n=1 Tax=uncultured Clostridium sp. TaxID=59620 RepID=UPI0026087E24|nr:stage V sporulation protein AD [uncultured Clostridium sp.]